MDLKKTIKIIINNEPLMKKFMAAIDAGQDETVAFLHSLKCDVTKEEMIAALSDLTSDQELSEEIEAIAGGGGRAKIKNTFEAIGENTEDLLSSFRNVPKCIGFGV